MFLGTMALHNSVQDPMGGQGGICFFDLQVT